MPTFTPHCCAGSALPAWAGAFIPIAAFLGLGAAVSVFPDFASELQLCSIILAAGAIGLVLAIARLVRTSRTGWRNGVPAVASALLINGYVATGALIVLLDLLKRR